jgi:hypothetical protein
LSFLSVGVVLKTAFYLGLGFGRGFGLDFGLDLVYAFLSDKSHAHLSLASNEQLSINMLMD